MAKLKLTNLSDLALVEAGHRTEARTIEIEALVDTRATTLVIPAEVAQAIGLQVRRTRKVRYADDRIGEVGSGDGIELEILGRTMVIAPLIEKEGTTPLVGQIPLEELDLVVDPKSRELRVNPASPDMPLLDLLAHAS